MWLLRRDALALPAQQRTGLGVLLLAAGHVRVPMSGARASWGDRVEAAQHAVARAEAARGRMIDRARTEGGMTLAEIGARMNASAPTVLRLSSVRVKTSAKTTNGRGAGEPTAADSSCSLDRVELTE